MKISFSLYFVQEIQKSNFSMLETNFAQYNKFPETSPKSPIKC